MFKETRELKETAKKILKDLREAVFTIYVFFYCQRAAVT